MATNIIRRRGDTFPYVIQIVDKCTGVALDVTGYAFQLAVDSSKAPDTSSANIMQLTGVITDATNGIVEFTPTTGEADNVGDYYYDIEMTDDNSKIRTIDNGKFILKQDISK